MAETPWTPGPWTGPIYHNDVGPDDDGFWEWWSVETADDAEIAKCNEPADAALCAAAPELAEIVAIFLGEDERFHVAIGGNPFAVDKMLANARAVLAKARGLPSHPVNNEG